MACLFFWSYRARSLLLPFVLLAASADATAEAGSVTNTPEATVKKVTDDVLAVLDANKDELRKNPIGVTTLIAGIVEPYFDYALMSKAALGVAWRSADARQRESFTQVFRGILLTDYAAVFGQYTNQTIKLTGMRWDDSAHRRATVMSQISSPGTQQIEVNYRLHFTNDTWQVYDVTAEGVSLLLNYRSVFASELQKENLDAFILRLQQKVAAKKQPVSQ